MHVGRKLEPFPLEMNWQWSWRWGEGKFWFMLQSSCSEESREIREVVDLPCASASTEGTIHAIWADPLCLGVRVFGKEQSQHLSSALQEFGCLMISTSKLWFKRLDKLITSATYQKWMKVRISPHILFFEEVLPLCSHFFSLSWKDLCLKRVLLPTDSKTIFWVTVWNTSKDDQLCF